MKILLTGGAGDLGRLLARDLAARGDVPLTLDIRKPEPLRGEFVEGSILDRDLLARLMPGMDVVVHIAAWHGIHEAREDKDTYDFWDVNVTGTFNVFEAAARAEVEKFVYISSTSIDERDSIYGHTKVLGEEIARHYASRYGMDVITLRPRAFIPHWNRWAYQTYLEWVEWFWGGAVHIDDVEQAVIRSIDLLAKQKLLQPLTLVVDGAYDYSEEDLRDWDAEGPGSSFRRTYPEFVALAEQYHLETGRRPRVKDISETRRWLAYEPRYSLRNLLNELREFGEAGPPPPEF